MLANVEANLIADVIWLPLGALILFAGRRILRGLREEWRDQQRRDQAEHRELITAQLTEHRERIAADLADR